MTGEALLKGGSQELLEDLSQQPPASALALGGPACSFWGSWCRAQDYGVAGGC